MGSTGMADQEVALATNRVWQLTGDTWWPMAVQLLAAAQPGQLVAVGGRRLAVDGSFSSSSIRWRGTAFGRIQMKAKLTPRDLLGPGGCPHSWLTGSQAAPPFVWAKATCVAGPVPGRNQQMLTIRAAFLWRESVGTTQMGSCEVRQSHYS